MADDSQKFDELSELLSAYLDDELSAAERARVEAELVRNPQLRQLHDELRGVRAGLTLLPRHTAPRQLADGVLSRIAEKSANGTPGNSTTAAAPAPHAGNGATASWGAWAPALAVAALVLLAVGIFYRPDARDVARHAPATDNKEDEVGHAPADKHKSDLAGAAPMATKSKATADEAIERAAGDQAIERESEDRSSFGKAGAMPAAKSAAAPIVSKESAFDAPPAVPSAERKQMDQELQQAPMLDSAPSRLAVPGPRTSPNANNGIAGQAGANALPPAISATPSAGRVAKSRLQSRNYSSEEFAVQQQVVEMLDDDLASDVLVVACDVTPKAIEQNSLERLLSAQQIAVVDFPDGSSLRQRGQLASDKPQSAAAPPLAKDEAASADDALANTQEKLSEQARLFNAATAAERPADEVVLVEATPTQIAALLDELEQRPTEFSQVAVLTAAEEHVAGEAGKKDLAGREANIDRYMQAPGRARSERAAQSQRRKTETRNEIANQSQAYRIQLTPRDALGESTKFQFAPGPGTSGGPVPADLSESDSQTSDADVAAEEAPTAPGVANALDRATDQKTHGAVAQQFKRPDSDASLPGTSRVLLLLRAVPPEAADR